MAKNHKLKAALDRHKGVDHKIERQRKLQKQAEKRKREAGDKSIEDGESEDLDASASDLQEVQTLSNGRRKRLDQERAADSAEKLERREGEAEGWETDESEDAEDDEDGGVDLAGLEDDSESDSEDEEPMPKAANREEDIPLSDLDSIASEDKGDVIPHQRLTINNTAALQRSLKSFALPLTLPFSSTQSVTSAEPVQIVDVEDDLNRELTFYKQSLDAVEEARKLLKKEGIPFSRPVDYFAEMVKSEEQMGKVRQKMVDEAARKKASAEARRQRDLKKFGKAVQVAKLQERDKAKRDTMDRISVLKRKRQGADLNANEEDMFDVALDDAAEGTRGDRAERRAGGRDANGVNRKRQKKDERFGFGGKKRFAKSNDARSSSEMKSYSVKKMKGKGAAQRPGKSRRAKRV